MLWMCVKRCVNIIYTLIFLLTCTDTFNYDVITSTCTCRPKSYTILQFFLIKKNHRQNLEKIFKLSECRSTYIAETWVYLLTGRLSNLNSFSATDPEFCPSCHFTICQALFEDSSFNRNNLHEAELDINICSAWIKFITASKSDASVTDPSEEVKVKVMATDPVRQVTECVKCNAYISENAILAIYQRHAIIKICGKCKFDVILDLIFVKNNHWHSDRRKM